MSLLNWIFKGTAPNDKTGTPARIAADIINQNFAYLDAKVNNSDHVVTLGTFSLVDQDLTIHAGWVWQINGINYTNPVDVVIPFDFSSSGNQRLDRIVFNTSNTFTVVEGPESVSNPVALPVPANTIDFGVSLITEDSVGEPSTPIEGGSYVKKMESQDFIVSYGVTTVIDQIDLIDDRSSISLTGAITDVKSLQLSGEFVRPGKPFFVKNRTGHAVKLWHNSGTGNISFFFPNGLDLDVNANEVIQFNLNANDSSDYKLEYVGGSSNLGYQINSADEKVTINDNDKVGISDSEDSNKTKFWKFSTIKSTLKTYFDTLYLGIANNQNVTGVKTFFNGMFGFRNIANTFTSFFSNSNTASRTYTFQNRNGIIADDTDLAGKMATPSLTVNKMTKAIASNAIGNSRITDDGTYIGIDNQWILLEDFIFGYLQATRTIGIEDSESTVAGRPLNIRGGRASNKSVASTTFMPLSQANRNWTDMTVLPNGDVYACVFGGDIYKQTGGTGNFIALGQTSRNWSGLDCNAAGDVYATEYISNGNIYKQTGGTGNFISLAQTGRYYSGVTCHINGDVYASVYAVGPGIYKQTGGTGVFNSLGVAALSWTNIKATINGDVYACVLNGDIYKQTGGAGGFVGLGQVSRAWTGLGDAPNGDIYASIGNKFTGGSSGDIYKQTGGTGNFIGLGQTARMWNGLTVNSIGNVYACVFGGDIYFLNQSTTGSPDLDGGALNLIGASAKGNGKSRVNIYTGAKLVSGTAVQTETLRAYYDENGNYIFLTIPTYANDAAADADSNLPSKAYYKTTGNRAVYQKP